MENFKKNIEGIRHLMKDMKAEKYAIINPDLVEVDEYIKNLYIKVLCTVIQYDNDPSDMQVLFLKRIVCGMKLDDSVEEYMRKALEISEDDIHEFISIFTEQKYKYYFALDGLLLVSMGNGKGMNYEYLAELVELIEINKMDLEYISLVARSVLQQESSFYEQAKTLINDRVSVLDFTPYISNYYVGAVVNTDVEKHYLAPDKSISSGIICSSSYRERKVTFENLEISLNDRWTFEGCEEVVFRNCNIVGGNNCFVFNRVGKIVFDSCEMKNFSNGVAWIDSINCMVITDSEFLECGRTGSGDFRGGMFIICGTSAESIKVQKSKFLNCHVSASSYRSNYGVSGVFMYFEGAARNSKFIEINGNEFIGCDCINNGNYTAAIISYFYGEKVDENNKYSGKLQRLFE